MSDPLKKFLDTAHDNDVDDALLKTSFVKKTLHKLENYGKDLEQKLKDIGKPQKPPKTPSGPTPTYQESAFVNKNPESTLYNVTNREKEVTVVERVSKVFKKTSYKVRGFNLAATYKKEDNKYSVLLGEKVGFKLQNQQGMFNKSIGLEYNLFNNKTNLKYSSSSPEHSYSVSLYKQRGNHGLTAAYYNHKGLSSAFSVDEKSSSISFGYRKDNVELGAYATMSKSSSSPFVGITGRVTM